MVIAAPRSGTTWASNWLTTDKTICLHDPLWTHHYTDLDHIKSDKMVGISCTGLYQFPDFVNSHPARKVILHRDESEINKSLESIGLSALHNIENDLYEIKGWHVDWRDLFVHPKTIYEFLTGLKFDEERHNLLKQIEMQPHFDGLKIGRDVTKRLIQELSEIMKNV